MKIYIDECRNLLTKKQFEKKYFDEEEIFTILLDEHFQKEFIKFCHSYIGPIYIKKILNHFIQHIQGKEKLFSEYLKYWNIEEKEIDDNKIIKILKDN